MFLFVFVNVCLLKCKPVIEFAAETNNFCRKNVSLQHVCNVKAYDTI